MASTTQITLAAPDAEAVRLLFGHQDETRRLIEKEVPITLTLRDETLIVAGPEDVVPRAAGLVEQLLNVAKGSISGGRPLAIADVRRMLQSLNQGSDMSQTQGLLTDTVLTSERGKPIGPRTAGQKVYL